MLRTFLKLRILLNILNFFVLSRIDSTTGGTMIIRIPHGKEDILANNQTGRPSNQKYIIIINNPEPSIENESSNEFMYKNVTKLNNSRRFSDHEEYLKAQKAKHEAKQAVIKKATWKRQHGMRMAFIKDAITNGYWTALYLHREMKRIQQQRVVMDDMRKMIAHLEVPHNEKMKADVLKCYRSYKPVVTMPFWVDQDTNNLITTLFHLNNADDYEFHDNYITILEDDIRKTIRSDLYNVNQIENMPISNLKYLLIIVRNDNKELDKTEDLAEALRMGAVHLEQEKIAAHNEIVKKNYLQSLQAERVKRANARRVQEVKAFMKFNYKATEYLYSEVMRIKRERIILDGPRQIISDVERSNNKTLIKEIENCLSDSIDIHRVDQWEGTPNKITIHTVADPINDGVD